MSLEKIADVLDALAGYVDATDAEKTAEARVEKEALIASIGEKHAAATGEDISDEMLLHLSRVDTALLQTMDKVAGTRKEASDETTLGGPSDRGDLSVEPTNKKEAAERADDQFLNWIVEE